MTFEPTDEQRAILAHSITRNARVLAGPGTGKSATSSRAHRSSYCQYQPYPPNGAYLPSRAPRRRDWRIRYPIIPLLRRCVRALFTLSPFRSYFVIQGVEGFRNR